MDSLRDLLSRLGPEIEDPEEETFLLYSQPFVSHNLGFIDPRAHTLDVAIHQRDYTILQSPGILSSSRAGGTTGAVLWKITPLLAEWLSSPSNPLFSSRALSRSSSIIELGCGISPLNALALRPLIARYILTDQPYVLKLLQANIDANPPPSSSSRPAPHPPSPSPPLVSRPSRNHASPSSSRRAKHSPQAAHPPSADIASAVLDWETDRVTPALTGDPATRSLDAVIACDCVYNYALIRPLVQTCADLCRLRLHDHVPEDSNNSVNSSHNNTHNNSSGSSSSSSDKTARSRPPCLAIIAQQLRNDDVFTSWLEEFRRHFRVWRVPEDELPENLRPTAGFVIHVGVLKEYTEGE